MGASESATSRLERFMGREALERLTASRVIVLGLGGVGASCVEALARGGVGGFVLVDGDAVEESNINRQAIAFYSTVGQRKVDVMRRMVLDINPRVQVDMVDRWLVEADVAGLIEEHGSGASYIVDALDSIGIKLAIAQKAHEMGIPVVSSMGAGNKLYPELLRFADIYDTHTCPLCRHVRKGARQRGIEHLRVLYSPEPEYTAMIPEGADRMHRSTLGTASYFPPIMGQMIASDVVCALTGLSNPDARVEGRR